MNELSVNDALDEIESESFDFIWEEWEEYKGDVPLWQHIFCGSVAGLMEHVFMYPLDTMKTYFQTNNNLKCKENLENCNLYSCRNNCKELSTHKNIHIDKRNFCSSIGCGNCLNKTCNYENSCNIKMISHYNKKKISYSNVLELLKKKSKINKFHYNNSNLYNENISHIVNKKLQNNNNYYNKKINRYINNNKCVNSYCKYLLNLKKNGQNSCDTPQEKPNRNLLYKCKNKRINHLKRNINNLESPLGKNVMRKMEKLSNIYNNNMNNNIKKLQRNVKKQFTLLSFNNKEKKMYCSKKVTSKIILKKDKKKHKCSINYYKYSLNNNNIKNYYKKLKLLNTFVNIKQNNYIHIENNLFNFFVNKNNLTLMNNLKKIYVYILNKCYSINNCNSNHKRKDLLKFPFQNFLYNGNKNVSNMLNSSLNFFKKTNYFSLNYIFKKNFIYKNYYVNILNAQKKKNHLGSFMHLFQNMRNFLNYHTYKNITSGTKKIIRKKYLFSILSNDKNILLNDICYFTKNNNANLFNKNIISLSKYNLYKNNNTNLFDRNIHSLRKFNLYKNNNNSILNRFNNNFKNFNFFKNILIHKNKKNDMKIVRYNCSLIRNNFSYLYKGVNVVMLGCIPAHAMYFSTFEYSKKYFSNMNSNNSAIRILNNNKNEAINYKLNYFSIIISGFLATIAHDLIITPVDTLKQRIQLGINKNGLESIKVLKENGIRSLYLSLPITLLMNIPYQIIMICTNEQMKKFYFEYIFGFSGLNKNSSENKYNNLEDNNIKKKDNINIDENIKNVSTTNDINNNNNTNFYENKNFDKIINNLKEEKDKTKLIKFYIGQDIYSMNNFSKNKERRFFREDEENEETNAKTFSDEKNNSHILFKEIIKKLENNCNDDQKIYDKNIRDPLDFEKQKYMDLRNIWMNNYKNEFFSKHFNHITSYFVCAGIGGGIAAILTNPFDVIKTRIQTECFNTKGFHFFKVVSNLYYKEGLGSFFKGSLARMALCIPASAISWGSYETMKRFFKINFNSI
ncbi:mitochondrial carrier protein, putative [Plasmodium relictum]|uniref:Mitochondrial carrier protein, putative n=1 Tax=Plasmodium relictum TaxID=85471 RepID=A0A1J1H6N4_PLARL|nr:mitochondrial carrier protein, putative [Plasmodium relictum]CRG99259.1 mitochondrial carrier protein, putative [Plasmodium relictum]